ncbi:hypothetical protein SAMN05216439_1808 [Methanobrevibacter gottschalkii]|uniref:Uncharacterized protein n=1 Tax=Methanobrevibacter gottschalkii TaxID=190974 RepID=A0A1H7LRA5_9EURY|nr:hypothetical protein SAMN05216439_1808 [Methanobrevibacter gottschalkii]
MLQKHFALSKEVLNHIFCFNIDLGIGGKIISINISIVSEIKKNKYLKHLQAVLIIFHIILLILR